MDTLLDSGKYSDLRIVCRDQSWNVHRNIISTASHVLEEMVDKLPRASLPSVIDLTKYEPKIVEKMLRFIYQSKYDDEREIDNPRPDLKTEAGQAPLPDLREIPPQEPGRPFWNGEALMVNLKVFIVAVELQLWTLREHAAKKYEETVGELWRTLSFVRSIELFYSSKLCLALMWPIRNAMVEVIAKNAQVLLTRKTFQKILKLHGDLTIAVLSCTVNANY